MLKKLLKMNKKELSIKLLLYAFVLLFSLLFTQRYDVHFIKCDIGDILGKKSYEAKIEKDEILKNLYGFSVVDNIITSIHTDPQIYINTSGINVFKYIRLDIDLMGRESINSQFFYLPAGREGYFSEEESIWQTIYNGINYIRLTQEEYSAIRIDLTTDEGVSLIINQLELTNNRLPEISGLLLLLLINFLWCGIWLKIIFIKKGNILINNIIIKINDIIDSNLNVLNKTINKEKKYFKIMENIFIFPIIISLSALFVYGINVIFWDEWSLVRLYESLETKGFFTIAGIKELFKQHNEHRIFFPGIIFMISHKLTDFNVKIAMLITHVMVISMYMIYVKFINNICKDLNTVKENILKMYFVLLAGIACLNYIQFNNLIWGFQTAFFMAIFGSVICLYFFQLYCSLEKRKYCVVSIIFGIIASFSSMHGVFLWPVLFILIIICFLNGEKEIIKKGIPFYLAGILCGILYFYGWKPVGGHPEISRDIIKILEFLFGSFGGIYTGKYSNLTVFLGFSSSIFIICLFIYILKNKKIKDTIFPIGLIGYGTASLLSIAAGRAGFGQGASIASRYMSFSLLVCAGSIILAYMYIMENNKKEVIKKININKLILCCTGIIGILLIKGFNYGLMQTKSYSSFYKENITLLQNYENQQLESLRRLYPWRSYEQAYIDIGRLKKYGFNVFSASISSFNEIPKARLTGMNKIELTHNVGIDYNSFNWDDSFIYTTSSCWVIDYINNRSYTQVYMRVNDRLFRTADNIPSPDVAQFFNNKHYNNVRFSFSLPIDKLNIGENYFSAIVILNDGITYYETEQLIFIKNDDGVIEIK